MKRSAELVFGERRIFTVARKTVLIHCPSATVHFSPPLSSIFGQVSNGEFLGVFSVVVYNGASSTFLLKRCLFAVPFDFGEFSRSFRRYFNLSKSVFLSVPRELSVLFLG